MPTVLAYSAAPDASPQLVFPVPSPTDPSKPTPPVFESYRGRFGMQVRGRSDGSGAVAVFPFSGVQVPHPGGDGRVTFEARIGIESSGDFDKEANVSPIMAMHVYNRTSGQTTAPIDVHVESNRVIPLHRPC